MDGSDGSNKCFNCAPHRIFFFNPNGHFKHCQVIIFFYNNPPIFLPSCGINNPAYTSAILTSPCLCVSRITPPIGEWAASQISSPSSCSLSAPEATAVRCGDVRRRDAVGEMLCNGRMSAEREREQIHGAV